MQRARFWCGAMIVVWLVLVIAITVARLAGCW
jgi:hypothetical protein